LGVVFFIIRVKRSPNDVNNVASILGSMVFALFADFNYKIWDYYKRKVKVKDRDL
jgi:hypothetical protein